MKRLFVLPVLVLALCVDHGLAGAADQPGSDRPLIVAHRGLLRHAPENTLANFAACLKLHLGFELDVRRSKDGHLVCVHDKTVDRTTDGQGKVEKQTLAQLKRLDAGGWFDAAFKGELIPTLDEVFALVADAPTSSALVAVDLKGDDPRIEVDCVNLARKHGVLDRLLFIGRAIDMPEVRTRLREANPAAHVASLAQTQDDLDAAIRHERADWVYVRFVPNSEQIGRVHATGKRVLIVGATVAGLMRTNWRAAARSGVDGILTDYPLELRPLLRTHVAVRRRTR